MKQNIQSLHLQSSPSQVRNDLWNQFLDTVDELNKMEVDSKRTPELISEAEEIFNDLRSFEKYWVYPGTEKMDSIGQSVERKDYNLLQKEIQLIARLTSHYGDRATFLKESDIKNQKTEEFINPKSKYFTVLMVNDYSDEEQNELRSLILELQSDSDFIYDILQVSSFQDALLATHANRDIQVVFCWEYFDIGEDEFDIDENVLENPETNSSFPGAKLAKFIKELRPELDLYLVTRRSLADSNTPTHHLFNRVFYEMDNSPEFHMSLLAGIRERFSTPFFDALKKYAAAPIGNFHALPIARGNSILNSRWIGDMIEFYGLNVFLAETSATSGGLDSLNAPTGTLKEAQEKASKAWGSMHTYFVTGGTSMSNKAVVQALVRPGDIVLIDRNSHKSHHYGMVLGGANALYLDSYPLQEYAMFGAIPLRSIKQKLLELKKLDRLDRVSVILLTSCTFDGITYNQQMFMEELLAIKPDLCFLWDEAWYAYATFNPLTRQRTAMFSAKTLEAKYASESYRKEYEQYKVKMSSLDSDDDATWLDNTLMPDPDKVRIRVYSTHSTHKSMSSLRQGSMLHIYDQDYRTKTVETLNEAILTHSTTSPNYQILASLDLARRQADFEGYSMIADIYQIAFYIRHTVKNDALLSKYFKILEPEDFIPSNHRKSGLTSYVDSKSKDAIELINQAWEEDEFVLDPTRLTLYLAKTGFSGNEFKIDVLMNKYGIQINKTSINSVLFIITIGVNWSSTSNLIDVLKNIASDLENSTRNSSKSERILFENKVKALSTELPPLASFSHFHSAFRPKNESPEGDMRTAFFLNYDENKRTYIKLNEAIEIVSKGQDLVSTTFVVPYPPGFPILVPGQVITEEILNFLQKLDIKEIHGYQKEVGLSVFTEDAVKEVAREESLK